MDPKVFTFVQLISDKEMNSDTHRVLFAFEDPISIKMTPRMEPILKPVFCQFIKSFTYKPTFHFQCRILKYDFISCAILNLHM